MLKKETPDTHGATLAGFVASGGVYSTKISPISPIILEFLFPHQ